MQALRIWLTSARCLRNHLLKYTHKIFRNSYYILKWLYSVPIPHISNFLYAVLLLDHSISGLPAVSVVTWHGSVWDTQLGVPLNQLGISPGLSGITRGWRGISSDCLFQGREGHRLAKLPLTQTQGTGGGQNHTHSGTTCNLSYSWILDLKTHPPTWTDTHKQDDREKHVVENYMTGNHQLVIMMMPWLATVRNLSNLSSRWIHQIKRVWDDDKSLQVQWGCSSLIQG